jgi:hypothetical protein
MIISTYGTAFTSYDVKANHKTKEEISDEKVSFDETVTQTHQVEDVVYHTTTQADDAKPTTFIDPVTKKYVIASLENETLDKLRGHFGTDNVIEKEDGGIRLTGEAEAFVSGWFADIAYKREFLTADANSDGQLSEDEHNNTRNDFVVEGMAVIELLEKEERLLAVGEKVVDNYVKALNNNGYRELQNASSLDDELNNTILLDSNFNGKMTLEEAYSHESESNAETVILRHLDELGITTIPSDIDTSNFDHLLNFILDVFLQKDEKEQEKIMSRFNDMIESGKEPTKENIEQIYTQENLEQLKRLKEDTKENTNGKLEVYS